MLTDIMLVLFFNMLFLTLRATQCWVMSGVQT